MAEPDSVPGDDVAGVLVEAGGEADGVCEAQAHHGAGQGGKVAGGAVYAEDGAHGGADEAPGQ